MPRTYGAGRTITQMDNPLPYGFWCDEEHATDADRHRGRGEAAYVCNVCNWIICEEHRLGHNDHLGLTCYECGYATHSTAQTIACSYHDFDDSIVLCEPHWNDYHRYCDGTNEPEDDEMPYEEAYGHPAVMGFGRDAALVYLDEPFITHTQATGRRAAALELEVEFVNRSVTEPLVLMDECGIVHDGSLSNGIEVTTPPARGSRLATVVLETTKTLREGGYGILDSCGMHTHIDLRDKVKDTQFLSHLFNAFITFEDVLYAMQRARRHTNSYSIPLRESYKFYDMYGQNSGDFDFNFYRQPRTYEGKITMDREKDHKYAGVRYNAANFHSVYYRGSLEVRIHEGCVDGDSALQWIEVLQAMIARVEKGHSYSFMQKWADKSVTPEKFKAFCRYFGLNKSLRLYVENRIAGGQGFGFNLGHMTWGVPRKGRPRAEPRPMRHRLNALDIGYRVSCYNCDWVFVLRARTRRCPHCDYELVDRWGARNYRRTNRALSTVRPATRAAMEFDFERLQQQFYQINVNSLDFADTVSNSAAFILDNTNQ